MDPTKFVAPRWGRAVSTGGPAAYYAFVPAPVPCEHQITPETIMLLSEADSALGRLAGAGRLLPNPHLLVNAYITREAVTSSRIEGTQASVTEVFDAAMTGTSDRGDIQEQPELDIITRQSATHSPLCTTGCRRNVARPG